MIPKLIEETIDFKVKENHAYNVELVLSYSYRVIDKLYKATLTFLCSDIHLEKYQFLQKKVYKIQRMIAKVENQFNFHRYLNYLTLNEKQEFEQYDTVEDQLAFLFDLEEKYTKELRLLEDNFKLSIQRHIEMKRLTTSLESFYPETGWVNINEKTENLKNEGFSMSEDPTFYVLLENEKQDLINKYKPKVKQEFRLYTDIFKIVYF